MGELCIFKVNLQKSNATYLVAATSMTEALGKAEAAHRNVAPTEYPTSVVISLLEGQFVAK